MNRIPLIQRLVRQLSGSGALDNVSQVLDARTAIDAELAALEARFAPLVVETAVAA